MPGLRYQPQGAYNLSPRYASAIRGGFLPRGTGYTSLGPAKLTPLSRFNIVARNTVTTFGFSLTSDSASDNRGNTTFSRASAMRIEYLPTRNAFTFMGVFKVRSIYSPGAIGRAGAQDIFFWHNNGLYGVRIANINYTGAPVLMNTDIHYVMTSSPEGIFVYVNGVEMLAAPATSSTATLGNTVELYEDGLYAGGAADLDVGLFALMSIGIGRDEAKQLSSNLWQIFVDPEDNEYEDVQGYLAKLLYLHDGGYTETPPMPDARPLVMLPNGSIQERVLDEGEILILDQDYLRTVK